MTKQEKIEYILKTFDFEKVHDLIIKSGTKFPSLIELKEIAKSNLQRLDCFKPSYILCGGFLATHFNGELSLYFTPEWSSIEDNGE